MNNIGFKLFISISILLIILRLLFISNTVLIDDEAYYAMYAKHLDWGYIDHGPVVAFLIKIFSYPFLTSFNVRIGAVICSMILAISLFFFGKKYFNTKTGVSLSLLLSANLLFHTNSTILTPDVPLAFFLILSIMGYFIAYHYNERMIYVSGFFLGMAMLAKITALFTAIAIALYPMIIPNKRYWLYKKSYYLSFLLGITVFMPFIIWNFQNNFAFIKYQGSHVTEGGDLNDFLNLWLPLIVMLGPIFYYYSVIFPLKMIKKWNDINEKLQYFILITLIPFCYFFIHSMLSRFELNWPAPVFFGGLFIMAIEMNNNKIKKGMIYQTTYSLILISIITIQTFHPFLPIKSRSDITNRYFLYNDLIEKIPQIITENPKLKGLRIASNNYQIPSMINFYLNPDLEATCLSIGYHNTLYSFIHNIDDLIGEDFLFIKPRFSEPGRIESHFESMELIAEVSGKRGDNIISKYSVWYLKNYYGK